MFHSDVAMDQQVQQQDDAATTHDDIVNFAAEERFDALLGSVVGDDDGGGGTKLKPPQEAGPTTRTTIHAANAAKLKSKLREVLRMKRSLLQKKLEMSKQAGASGGTSSSSSNSSSGSGRGYLLAPITGLVQLESTGLHISNINAGPEHLTRFSAKMTFEGFGHLAGDSSIFEYTRKKKSAPAAIHYCSNSEQVQVPPGKQEVTQITSTTSSSFQTQEGIAHEITSFPPDRKLKKRKLELLAQLEEARRRRSRLEQERNNSAGIMQVVRSSETEPKPPVVDETTSTMTTNPEPPNYRSQAQAPCSFSREELLQKKKLLEFRSNVTNLKHIVSKQEVLLASQEESLAATEAARIESEKALSELRVKLENVRRTVQTSKVRERALMEVEKKKCAELSEARCAWIALKEEVK